jgi:hypothetical protein
MPKSKKAIARKRAPRKKSRRRSVKGTASVRRVLTHKRFVSRKKGVIIEDASGAKHGLGYVQIHDERDFNYPMSPHIGEIDGDPLSKKKVYWLGPILDQRDSQTCVGHAWTLFVTSEPRRTKPGPDPYQIYQEAQLLESIAGQQTTVRAGAKVMLKDKWITGDYVWARNADELWRFVLTRGPVVLGSPWYEGMRGVDGNGFVNLTGRSLGGHCYLCYGVSGADRAFLCASSWGPNWGRGGTFRLRYADGQKLFSENAIAACSAVEDTNALPA